MFVLAPTLKSRRSVRVVWGVLTGKVDRVLKPRSPVGSMTNGAVTPPRLGTAGYVPKAVVIGPTAGKSLIIARPVGLIRLAGMMLFGNCAPVVGSMILIKVPRLSVVCEKSPASSAAVGMV